MNDMNLEVTKEEKDKKPSGKSLKAYNKGKKDFADGKAFYSSPYLLSRVHGLLGWWQKGYEEEKRRLY
jgi:hypothetical protein